MSGDEAKPTLRVVGASEDGYETLVYEVWESRAQSDRMLLRVTWTGDDARVDVYEPFSTTGRELVEVIREIERRHEKDVEYRTVYRDWEKAGA